MSKLRMIYWLGAGVLTLALVFPLPAQEGPTKIKVIVENASIRLKPSLDSEAIEENIAVGTTYTADKKVGEWYEIKTPSRLGVALLGYIHEMYVEVLAEAIAPQPEVSQPERRPEPPGPTIYEMGVKKLEIFAGAGMGFGSFLNETTNYSGDYFINSVAIYEEGKIQHKIKSPFGLGLSFSYFLTDSLGVRLRIDPNFSQKISDSLSLYSADYSWSGGENSDQGQWDTTGSLSVLPLSFDLVYRFSSGMFSPYFNAGVSYFMANFKADATAGWAYAWSPSAYDYADIPVSINEKINGLGFNLGGGLDFHLGPGLAVTVDAAYFIGKKAEVNWDVAPGSYSFNYYNSWTVTFDTAYAQNFSEYLGKVKVALSFFKVLVGIKLFL